MRYTRTAAAPPPLITPTVNLVVPNKYWSCVIDAIKPFPCLVRVKWIRCTEEPPWESVVFMPVGSHVETGRMGPVPSQEVEWIEISVNEIVKTGRLVPDQIVSRADALRSTLTEVGAAFEENNERFRIALPTS